MTTALNNTSLEHVTYQHENEASRIVIFEKHNQLLLLKKQRQEVSKILSLFKKKKSPKNVTTTVAFPMLRQTHLQTFSSDLISVQSLSIPSGMLFYYDKPEPENVFTKIVIIEKFKTFSYTNGYNRYFLSTDISNI